MVKHVFGQTAKRRMPGFVLLLASLALLTPLLMSLSGSAAQESTSALLYINEFMASNGESISDESGDHDDWVEIYNPGREPVDIGGFYISDDRSEPLKWQIPDWVPQKTTIPPGGFLLLWADGEPEEGPLHLGFKLSASGESIILTDPDGESRIDELDFDEQTRNVSFGRKPDGGKVWEFFSEPTPGSSNSTPAVSSLGLVDIILFYESHRLLVAVFLVLFILAILFTSILLKLSIRLKRYQRELRENEHKYRTLVEAVPDIVMQIDQNRRCVWINSIGEEFFGPDFIDRDFGECFVDQQAVEAASNKLAPLFAWSRDVVRVELWLKRKDGVPRLLECHCKSLRCDGSVKGILIAARDITDVKEMEGILQKSAQEYQSLFEDSPVGMLKINSSGDIIDVNKEMLKLLGSPGKAKTMQINLLKHPGLQAAGISQQIKDVIREGKAVSFEGFYQSVWGKKGWFSCEIKPIFDSEGKVVELIMACRDETKKKEAEDQIKRLTFRDPLTGLYNRTYFKEKLKEYDRSGTLPLSIIVGDVNGLKLVNDALGHQKGDAFLVEISRILKSSCRQQDLVARWGGDEFVILLPQTDSDAARSICSRIAEFCAKAEENPIRPSISLGFATKTEADEDIYHVFQQAEDSMYRTKVSESKRVQSQILSSLKRKLYDIDGQTYQERQRLVELTLRFGQNLGLSEKQLEDLSLLAEVYDIGKAVLLNDTLPANESVRGRSETLRRHSEVGYHVACCLPQLSQIAEGILNQQEWWDGSGYPQGLRGEEIPLMSRIIAVVDSFYSIWQEISENGGDKETALQMLMKLAGTKLDPNLVEVFADTVRANS